MIKKLLFFTLFLLANNLTFSQEDDDKALQNISLGYGVGYLSEEFVLNYGYKNNFNRDVTGPFYAKGELLYNEKINVLFMLGYANSVNKFETEYYENFSFEPTINQNTISVRTIDFFLGINYLFIQREKFDLYGSIGGGYRKLDWKLDSEDETVKHEMKTYLSDEGILTKLDFEITGGFRYYITDNIGLYTQLGYARSLLQFGITLRP